MVFSGRPIPGSAHAADLQIWRPQLHEHVFHVQEHAGDSTAHVPADCDSAGAEEYSESGEQLHEQHEWEQQPDETHAAQHQHRPVL